LRSLLGLRSFELHGAELESFYHNGFNDMTVALQLSMSRACLGFLLENGPAQALITAACAAVMMLVIAPMRLEKVAYLILRTVFGRDHIGCRLYLVKQSKSCLLRL
jgi:hypothetical protein